MNNVTSTSTSTSTSTAAPLTGSALLDHDAATATAPGCRHYGIAERAAAAGYQRPDGSAWITGYYNALQDARIAETFAAVGPDAWHGLTRNGQPERFALVVIADANGQQIGASLPVHCYESGWSDADTYGAAEQAIQRHAATYAAAADPEAFPLTVSIADRSGSATLFSIDSDGDLSDDLADGISRCERCGSIEDTDDGTTVNVRSENGWRFDAEHWCSDCASEHATECDDCGDHYENRESHTDDNNRDICSVCADNYYYTCSDCGELCHNDTHNTVDHCDSVCDRCIDRGNYYYHEDAGQWSTEPPEDDDDDEHQGPMRRYGYHTDANATLRHAIPDTGHTYGAEMEYKGDPSDWRAVAAACSNRAILTNDGTVSGELVSVALTAGQIRRWLASVADALTGSRNDSETGFHIHIDRRALTPWQWHTLSHYTARHSATFEAIAGRQPNQWQDLSRLPASDWPTFARNWRNRCWPTRYAGINFSKGPTVEVRICRATKTKSRALARFGMVQRLISLGRLAPSQRPQSAEELRGWLAQDASIRTVTGWEPGPYNYREACQRPTVEGDHQPQAPSPEAIQSLRDRIRRLQADLALTENLRQNAARQWSQHPNSVWGNDAIARSHHYNRDAHRIGQQLHQARTELENAQSLASIGTLTR